jgi:hypothetical protein
MNNKEKGRAPSATSKSEKTCLKTSTGFVAPQTEVIAVGKFRADLLDYMRSLPAMACGNKYFDFSHGGLNSVLSCGFERRDGSEAVVLEITLHDWHPRSSIPVLDLCSELFDLEVSADGALASARLSTRHGKTILTSREPRQLLQDLRDLKAATSRLFDQIEDQANWLPIPDDVIVSVKWFAVQPDGGLDEHATDKA